MSMPGPRLGTCRRQARGRRRSLLIDELCRETPVDNRRQVTARRHGSCATDECRSCSGHTAIDECESVVRRILSDGVTRTSAGMRYTSSRFAATGFATPLGFTFGCLSPGPF